MRTRMSGGVGGGSRKALPYPDLGGPDSPRIAMLEQV
jgi:hypothetical protein